MSTPLLKVEGLRKSFGGVAALRDGRFELEAGSVHALCGGNGAGKSTFLTILMGIQKRDGGTIWRRGQPVDFNSPAEALRSGIAIIEQELSPVPHMSVAENIYLGREPTRRFGGVDFGAMNRTAQSLLDDLGFAISARQAMATLSVAQVQLVEIAKALSHDAEVIFMDEPTSAIGEREAQHLFSAIERLKAQGRGIVYVSHRLSEIFQIADSYTVFRDGAHVGSGRIAEIDRPGLIRMIVGRELGEEYIKTNQPTDTVGPAVEGLRSPGRLDDISFAARKGEIFGIYGLMGSGRTEIFDCLFGLDPKSTGRILLDGLPAAIRKPADAMAAHAAERAALHAALRVPHDGPTVVVTHHPASPLAADRYRDQPGVPWWVPAFYASTALDDLPDAERPELWISGHFHAGHDLRVGRCRWVSNPVEGQSYRSDLCVTVGAEG